MVPVKLIVHYPTTPEGRAELEKRMAGVYADAVRDYIGALSCGSAEKVRLSEAVERRVCAGE